MTFPLGLKARENDSVVVNSLKNVRDLLIDFATDLL
jgi:hypothetical protein